jgi:hypothetical protein
MRSSDTVLRCIFSGVTRSGPISIWRPNAVYIRPCMAVLIDRPQLDEVTTDNHVLCLNHTILNENAKRLTARRRLVRWVKQRYRPLPDQESWLVNSMANTWLSSTSSPRADISPAHLKPWMRHESNGTNVAGITQTDFSDYRKLS